MPELRVAVQGAVNAARGGVLGYICIARFELDVGGVPERNDRFADVGERRQMEISPFLVYLCRNPVLFVKYLHSSILIPMPVVSSPILK